MLPLKASAKSMGLGHRARHLAHRRDGVRRADGAGRRSTTGSRSPSWRSARESRRILEELTRDVAHAAPALRAHAGAAGARSTCWRPRRAWASATAASALAIADDDRVVDAARGRATRCWRWRAAREGFRVVDNDVALGGAPARGADRQRPQRRRQDRPAEDAGAGGAAGARRHAGAGRRRAAASASSTAVLADIGDQQSVLGDLSTFSAHLANLGAILRHDARRRRRRWCCSTRSWPAPTPSRARRWRARPPRRWPSAPALAVITTHYDALKALAEGDARFRNAGMEYDPERLRPTFRLRDGDAGAVVRARHRDAHGAAGGAAGAGARAGRRRPRRPGRGDRALEQRETDLARATERAGRGARVAATATRRAAAHRGRGAGEARARAGTARARGGRGSRCARRARRSAPSCARRSRPASARAAEAARARARRDGARRRWQAFPAPRPAAPPPAPGAAAGRARVRAVAVGRGPRAARARRARAGQGHRRAP